MDAQDRIIVLVRGGVVQDIEKPPSLQNVVVEVRDYDVDFDMRYQLEPRDENGDSFYQGIW